MFPIPALDARPTPVKMMAKVKPARMSQTDIHACSVFYSAGDHFTDPLLSQNRDASWERDYRLQGKSVSLLAERASCHSFTNNNFAKWHKYPYNIPAPHLPII